MKPQEIQKNAADNAYKFGKKLKKKQVQELNTMRFATEKRNRLEIHVKDKFRMGDLVAIEPEPKETIQKADHTVKNRTPPSYDLSLDIKLEKIYGHLLDNKYSYGLLSEDGPGSETLDKRMVIHKKLGA